MNGKIKTQPQKRYYIQHREFFRFYFNFLNTGYFHYIQMAVKMKRGIESFFLKYLKLACKFKFTTPQRKILSMSCRRFNYINQWMKSSCSTQIYLFPVIENMLFLGYYFPWPTVPSTDHRPASFTFFWSRAQITFLRPPFIKITFSQPRIIKITISGSCC